MFHKIMSFIILLVLVNSGSIASNEAKEQNNVNSCIEMHGTDYEEFKTDEGCICRKEMFQYPVEIEGKGNIQKYVFKKVYEEKPCYKNE